MYDPEDLGSGSEAFFTGRLDSDEQTNKSLLEEIAKADKILDDLERTIPPSSRGLNAD